MRQEDLIHSSLAQLVDDRRVLRVRVDSLLGKKLGNRCHRLHHGGSRGHKSCEESSP